MKNSEKANEWKVLWIWVVLTFLILGSAWYALISVANKNAPEAVPLNDTE